VRLASKIFLASSLVIAVLVAVGALSLKAVADLVAVNREIAARAVPAVRVAAAARDGTLALVRLEARFLVLGDEQFAALWAERAARAREDLERLQTLLRTPAESALLRDVAGAFERYQGIVAARSSPWCAPGGRTRRCASPRATGGPRPSGSSACWSP
jgi:hypothetical protein